MGETSEKRLEKVRFMNMCMIQDGRGNVLALDKVNDSYTGTTFPGGHVEPGELFFQSMIREVWEETGLTIENPEFRGLYHWHKDGVHHVITLYRSYTFCGELESSEEGRVYWISLEELKNGTPHSRYFSDELGVPNFLLKPEQMFVIQRDVLYNTNMEKESRELYADCIQLWSRN